MLISKFANFKKLNYFNSEIIFYKIHSSLKILCQVLKRKLELSILKSFAKIKNNYFFNQIVKQHKESIEKEVQLIIQKGKNSFEQKFHESDFEIAKMKKSISKMLENEKENSKKIKKYEEKDQSFINSIKKLEV